MLRGGDRKEQYLRRLPELPQSSPNVSLASPKHHAVLIQRRCNSGSALVLQRTFVRCSVSGPCKRATLQKYGWATINGRRLGLKSSAQPYLSAITAIYPKARSNEQLFTAAIFKLVGSPVSALGTTCFLIKHIAMWSSPLSHGPQAPRAVRSCESRSVEWYSQQRTRRYASGPGLRGSLVAGTAAVLR